MNLTVDGQELVYGYCRVQDEQPFVMHRIRLALTRRTLPSGSKIANKAGREFQVVHK